VIVVIGSPIGRLDDDVLAAGGTASRVALAAARLGRTVQLVGKTGDDPTADGVVLDLARGGVGHVALLRDPGRATPLETVAPDAIDEEAPEEDPDTGVAEAAPPTPPGPALEAADVELGLRYLTDFAVVVLAEAADPQTIAVVADAARWGEARMILVLDAGETVPDGLPGEVTVFESPGADPDGAFADLVGTFAASIDEGTEPGAAFRSSIASDGWTEAGSA
jgi:pfkB family carbohydrate kinase